MPPDARLTSALAERYALESELGQGGMATVYLVRDLKHDRAVALKVLRPELAAVLGRERFLSEIRLTAKLDHPHILTLLDSGDADGFVWYTLPYIRGESLRHKLERERQLDVAEAVAIARQVAGALEHAHQHGIIHRDVKPENILLHEGEAMLADFGIALAVKEAGGQRLTETGLGIGTPQYMSPEQATAERQIDARSDVYSLGAVLYEMLAGEPPFTGVTAQAVIAKLMVERPTSLRTLRDTVPPGLDAAVARALAKVPADRFPSAAAFAAALATPERHGAPRRVYRRVLLLGGASVVVVAGATMWLGPRLRPRGAPPARVEPTLTQVTFTGTAESPALSPDGKQVAYAEKTCPSAGDCTYSIIVEDMAVAERRVLAKGVFSLAHLEWSPDGRFVIVDTWNGSGVNRDILVSALGGRTQDLSCCHSSFWGSADTILATRIAPQRAEVARRWVDLTTREGVMVDSLGFDLPGPSVWAHPSPSGQRLLLWTWRIDESEIFYLATRAGRITDSLEFNDTRFLRSVIDGMPVVGFQDPSGRAVGERLQWTADGDGLLVFMPIDHVQGGSWTLLRYSISPDGQIVDAPDTMATALRLPGFPRYKRWNVMPVSRAGDIALALGEPTFTVWRLERRGPGRPPERGRKLLSGTGRAGALIAPDGSQVLVVRTVSLNGRPAWQLVVFPFEGDSGRLVGPPQENLVRVGWSQDGGKIFRLNRGRRAGALELSSVDLASGQVQLLHTLQDNILPLPPTWGLPGGQLLHRPGGWRYEGAPLELSVFATAGAGAPVFSFPDSTNPSFNVWFRPGERGTGVVAIVVQTNKPRADAVDNAIYAASPGGRARLVTRFSGPWSPPTLVHGGPGESFEAVALIPPGSLRWLHIEPGQPPRDLGPLPVTSVPAPFSDDGRRGVAVETEERSDVWLLRWPVRDSTRSGA